MNSRFHNKIVAWLLGTLAWGAAFAACTHLALEDGLTAGAQRLGARAAQASPAWDYWFFIALGVLGAAGTVEVVLRRNWGRGIALLVLAATCVWAMLITVAPESWRDVWFSLSVARRVAALVAVLALGGFAWLGSRPAGSEFPCSERAA